MAAVAWRGFHLELRNLHAHSYTPGASATAPRTHLIPNTNKAIHVQTSCIPYMYASACPSPPSTSPIHSSWRCPLAFHEALVACSLPPMTLSGGATAPIGESATASGRVPSGSPLSVYEHSSWVSMERGLAEWLRLVVRFMLAAGLEASDHDLGRGAERRRLPFVVYLGSSSGLMCV